MEPSLTEINDHFTMLVNLLPSNLCMNQEEFYKLKKSEWIKHVWEINQFDSIDYSMRDDITISIDMK